MSKILKQLQDAKRKEFLGMKDIEVDKGNETLLLLSHDRDKETFDQLGVSMDNKGGEVFLKTRNTDNEFQMDSFTGEQIANICHKYALSISPIYNFVGSVPKTIAKEIREFSEKKNAPIKRGCYYVMGPLENFTNNWENSELQCTIFYRESDDYTSMRDWIRFEDVLVPVTEWGKEYNFLHTFRPLVTKIEPNSESFSMRERTFINSCWFLLSLIMGTGFDWFIASLFPLLIGVILTMIQLYKVKTIDKLWNGR